MELRDLTAGRLGLFGGSFDPVHFGHLRKAQEAIDVLGLSRVVFVPARVSPYKPLGASASAQNRVDMLIGATHGKKQFSVYEGEAFGAIRSFTVDTLKLTTPLIGRPILLMGDDAYKTLPAWKHPGRILSLADIVVFFRERDGASIPFPSELFHDMGLSWSQLNFVRSTAVTAHRNGFIGFLTTKKIAISSSRIRLNVRERKSIKGMVPRTTAEYIEDHLLYR